jgi:DNA-binding transcriptional regulator GbsR (MarR family)
MTGERRTAVQGNDVPVAEPTGSDGRDPQPLWESERIVSDAIGRLMEFWGFKRNMGRVWTILYLSAEPLTAGDLRDRLQLSSGAVSMTLTELLRWGTIRKHWVQGDRRDYFVAETNLWKMITRVLRERERVLINEAIEACEDALAYLDRIEETDASASRSRLLLQRERIRQLVEVARVGRSALDTLVSGARLDASWLSRALRGKRPPEA